MRTILTPLAALIIVITTPPTTLPAQTAIIVDIEKARLTWEWSQGTGGMADDFLLTCTSAAQPTPTTTPITGPATRSVPVKTVITGLGTWTCSVQARNAAGISPASNAVQFIAGTLPFSPTNLILEAQ